MISFSSCKKGKNESEKNLIKQTEINTEERIYSNCKKQIINGIEFEACINSPGVFTIKNSIEKIVYSHKDNPSEFKFKDFNEDGYSDIVLEYITNTPGTDELILFNKQTNSFEKVIDFMNFPSAIKIKNSELYYSYHKSGCADSNWDSDLFKIKESKAIRIGNIHGIGCGIDEKNGIYINRVRDKKVQLIKFIEHEEGYWDGKWNFIEKYWNENYKKFK